MKYFIAAVLTMYSTSSFSGDFFSAQNLANVLILQDSCGLTYDDEKVGEYIANLDLDDPSEFLTQLDGLLSIAEFSPPKDKGAAKIAKCGLAKRGASDMGFLVE